jgi:hypothetical protein
MVFRLVEEGEKQKNRHRGCKSRSTRLPFGIAWEPSSPLASQCSHRDNAGDDVMNVVGRVRKISRVESEDTIKRTRTEF